MTGSNLPPDLDTLASEINALHASDTEVFDAGMAEHNRAVAEHNRILKEIDRVRVETEEKRRPLRLEIGRLLIEARSRFDTGRQFEAWCADHIKRSRSECYACMKLAKADDPEAAIAAEREAARDRKRLQRKLVARCL